MSVTSLRRVGFQIALECVMHQMTFDEYKDKCTSIHKEFSLFNEVAYNNLIITYASVVLYDKCLH